MRATRFIIFLKNQLPSFANTNMSCPVVRFFNLVFPLCLSTQVVGGGFSFQHERVTLFDPTPSQFPPKHTGGFIGCAETTANPAKLKHEGNQCNQSTERPKLSVGKNPIFVLSPTLQTGRKKRAGVKSPHLSVQSCSLSIFCFGDVPRYQRNININFIST